MQLSAARRLLQPALWKTTLTRKLTAKFLIYAFESRSLLTDFKQMRIYPICGGFATESVGVSTPGDVNFT